MNCIVLPFEVTNGPSQMAADEAMLEGAESGRAFVRVYAWSVPTLSLGYFQPFADAQADGRFGDVPIVRRMTGGGAIWHDRELTYSVSLSRAHPLATRSVGAYAAVHEAVAAALNAEGFPARRRGESRPEGSGRPFLCFSDRDANDLVLGGDAKVLGSAQRRRRGALLQHGSLLLQGSPGTPEHPGLSDAIGREIAADPWVARLAELVAKALGLEADPGPWPEDLAGRCVSLERGVYRSDAWTRKR